MQEGVFHEMANLVQTLIVRSLDGAISLWGNHGVHALGLGLLQQGIGVIAPIRQQIIRAQAVDQGPSLGAIRGGTFRNKDSDRQTRRIHGQVYLGVEPPFVRLIA